MPNIFNEDFRDFLKTLNDHKVDYLLVGGYAVILHGYRRTTGIPPVSIDLMKEVKGLDLRRQHKLLRYLYLNYTAITLRFSSPFYRCQSGY